MTEKLRDISHTSPYTDESFGERVQVFDRGKTVAADGGADPDEDEAETSETAEDVDTMEEVDHEPPNESDGANRVYERGTEGRDDSV